MPRSLRFAAPLLILILAVGFVLYGSLRVPEPQFTGNLRDLLAAPPAGWQMKEKPIADTPEMKEAVGELLNFDDGVFVDYLGPAGERISVYLAYWSPGRMSHRLVAGHTPDVCWPGAGWIKIKEGDTSQLLPTVPTGETRTFTLGQVPEHVWYWHLVGKESKRYRTGFAPPWYASIVDIFEKGLNQREEQFFIRISSPKEIVGDGIPGQLLAKIPWSVEG